MSTSNASHLSPGSLIGDPGKLVSIPMHSRRRILRGRKVISVEQVMEELKAEMGISNESGSISELEIESSGCAIEERQQLIRQRAAIREKHDHDRLWLPNFNMVTDRAPPINLTVTASMLDESSSVATINANTDLGEGNETENINPASASSGSMEVVYDNIVAPMPQQMQPELCRSLLLQENRAREGKEDQISVTGNQNNTAVIGRESLCTTIKLDQTGDVLAAVKDSLSNTLPLMTLDKRVALVTAQEQKKGMVNDASEQLTVTEVGLKRAICRVPVNSVAEELIEGATLAVPIMLEEEQEPMEIDCSVSEQAERSRRTSAVNVEMVLKQNMITKLIGMRSQEEVYAVAIDRKDRHHQVHEENTNLNGQEEAAQMADLVVGTAQALGISRRWVNTAPRKSFAYGQNRNEKIGLFTVAAERYSVGPVGVIESDMKSLSGEFTEPVSEADSSENLEAPDGDHQDVTFTVASREDHNSTYTVVTEEEAAAKALLGLGEATNKNIDRGSSPDKNTAITVPNGKDTSENSRLTDGTNNTTDGSACAQEVTMIGKAMGNLELKKTPKTHLNDTMVAENGEASKVASNHSVSGGSTFGEGNDNAPAPFKETFNESLIARSVTETTHAENSKSVLDVTRSMRDEILNILDVTYGGHSKARKTNGTLLSFKTPKKTTAAFCTKVHSQKSASLKHDSEKAKQSGCSGRVTSTPKAEVHICPRFAAHQAASTTPKRAANRHSKTEVLPSDDRLVRIGPGTRILHSPIVTIAKEDPSSPFRLPAVPVHRDHRPSMALSQIAAYKSPSCSPSRAIQSQNIPNTANNRCSSFGTSSSVLYPSIVSPRPSSRNSLIPAPIPAVGKHTHGKTGMAAGVEEYLRSGGTPRPSSQTEGALGHSVLFAGSFAWTDNVMKSGPRTPTVRFDVSRMLTEKVAVSGPVSRRQPINRRSSRIPLPNLSKLNFDVDSDSGGEEATQKIQENTITEQLPSTNNMDISEHGETDVVKKVVIDSDEDDGYGIDALENDTTQLSIQDVNDSGDQAAESSKAGGKVVKARKSLRTKLLDLSIATLDSPNIEKDSAWRLQQEAQQRASLASSSDDACPMTSSDSPVHIVAANKKEELVAYLAKRKIVHPNNASAEGVRRSARNRIAPARRWLGEIPVYRVDAQGNRELVDVSSVRIRDPFLLKYGSASVEVAFERQKQAQKRHMHSRQLLRNAKAIRKQQKINELKEKHKHCEDLDVSVSDIKTSSESEGEQ